MNNKERLNYILKVIQGCKTNLEKTTAVSWGLRVMETYGASRMDLSEYKLMFQSTGKLISKSE